MMGNSQKKNSRSKQPKPVVPVPEKEEEPVTNDEVLEETETNDEVLEETETNDEVLEETETNDEVLEETETNDEEQEIQSAQENPLLAIEVKDKSTSFQLLIAFINLAFSRGAYTREEVEKIIECINMFTV
jgi:hypothetical protein